MLVKCYVEAIDIELFKIIYMILFYNCYYFCSFKTISVEPSAKVQQNIRSACKFIFRAPAKRFLHKNKKQILNYFLYIDQNS